jgi:hypothetical protein
LKIRVFIFIVALALMLTGLVPAWWAGGHASIAEAAALALPDDVPRFFRSAGKDMGYMAGDPDRWKNPSCKFLRTAESPDHFIDLEDYQGEELPKDRFKAIELLISLKQKPDRAGLLPYALMENYERLCCAFYDYRANPKNEITQKKCIIYAGILSHFTGDCVMPLHTTRNYDGKKDRDGNIQQKGIHAKIDGFPEKNKLGAEEISRQIKAKKLDDVWKHVLQQINDSHKLVEACYKLDRAGAFDRPTKESRAFILERCKVGAQFTADLWYTAWLQSEKMPSHW